MPPTWIPARPFHYLRAFAISLGLIFLGLAGFLFGVDLEAVVPADGVIVARDQQDLRALLPGLVEPGWYEGKIILPGVEPVDVRMDAFGDGQADPASALRQPIEKREYKENGRSFAVSDIRFHRLRPGDHLWPGQVLATIRADDVRDELLNTEDLLHQLDAKGERNLALQRKRDRLRDRLADAVIHVPPSAEKWMALEVFVKPFQAVKPGDVIASIVPIDPQTNRPLDLLARLNVAERHSADLTPGQEVRIYSTMYNHRLHGAAAARIDQLEPQGEAGANGHRQFHAQAPLTQAPFELRLGSTFHAEVVVGRKKVYRIILEH